MQHPTRRAYDFMAALQKGINGPRIVEGFVHVVDTSD